MSIGGHVSSFNPEAFHTTLAQGEIGCGFNHSLHTLPVEGLVRLRTRRANGRPLTCVQDAELNARLINGAGHLPTKRVNLPHQMAFAHPSDSRIARHLTDVIKVQRQHQGLTAKTCRRQCRLDPGMAGANNDNIIVHGSSPISRYRNLETRGRVSPRY